MMKAERYLTSIAIAAVLTAWVSADPVRWEIADGGNGHWYEAVPSDPDIKWTDAMQATLAREDGWHLVTITSSAENDFVLSLLQVEPDADSWWRFVTSSTLVGAMYAGPWIGAVSSSNASNDWSWVTGEPFSYSAWAPYEPFGNGDRVYFSQYGSLKKKGWNDVPNSYLGTGYIVETNSLEAVPIPGALLLAGLGLSTVGWVFRRHR